MVRMRDVLKSVRDIARGNADPTGQQKSGSGLSFPQTSGTSARTQDDYPSMSPERARINDGTVSPGSLDQGIKEDSGQSEKSDLYHDTIAVIHELLTQASNNEPFSLDEIEEKAENFVESLMDNDSLFLQSLSIRRSLVSMAQHSANVATVATKVAIGLRLPREKMVEVTLAAMVHEIGMTKIPSEVLNKKGELTVAEYEMIKQHPILGKQAIEPFSDEYPFLPDAIVQEHERWNGNGYPFGLKENEICEYAQIIGLADTFVALTHLRTYRDNFIAYKAMQSIIERRNIDFSARMIKALIEVISIFPVHSLVKLNDNRVARVLETNKQYPVRPVIEIIRDGRGNNIANPERVDLSREPMMYIVSPVLDESAYS